VSLIDAVLFDLDDTLFEQRSWLAGAWDAVSATAAEFDADAPALRAALDEIAAEGSDRGHIIDRALERVGESAVPIEPLVDAFRAHRPDVLPTYEGVHDVLAWLRDRVPVGLVTDGDPAIQEHKLAATGLADVFDVVVFSDRFGRTARKPNPFPFQLALEVLDVPPERAVYVGDRPDKDIAGATAAGLRGVRVRTGEYRAVAAIPGTWCSLGGVPEVRLLFGPGTN